MGISKAMMEKVMVATSRNLEGTGTVICGTRYGNVMASRGSVIPLFVEQALSGMPITVTDPAMTRFMMTLEDAVDLVLRLCERHQWRHLCPESPGGDGGSVDEGDSEVDAASRPRSSGDWHAPRREAFRGLVEP